MPTPIPKPNEHIRHALNEAIDMANSYLAAHSSFEDWIAPVDLSNFLIAYEPFARWAGYRVTLVAALKSLDDRPVDPQLTLRPTQ